MPILEVNRLSISFWQDATGMRQRLIHVAHRLDLAIEAGEVLAVIGASGSGKSLLAHAILGILPSNVNVGGTILYDGEALTPDRQAELRGQDIVLIPQSVNFLDPLMKVGTLVRSAVRKGDPAEIQRKMFGRVHLNPTVERLYPHQLSGGMARRILLSMAMVSGARVIIADEPTPGLDPALLKEAISSFREIADQGAAVMLITHDLESVLPIADKVAVFYAGTTIEVARSEDFSGDGTKLRHPYTRALWKALPHNGFQPIPGSQPQPDEFFASCAFAPRCEWATSECKQQMPSLRPLREGWVSCVHAT